MPAAAKTPFSSKTPATLAKSYSSLPVATVPAGNNASMQGGEVVCPLLNSDGSQCRKKCVGNFAYRSICEHIRRAHPDNWIPKLPASPETFARMVGLMPRGVPGLQGPTPPPAASRKHSLGPSTTSRKPSKLSKQHHSHEHDDQQSFLEGMSPPSSANESEPYHTAVSVATHQSMYQPKFPSMFPTHVHDYDSIDHDDEEHDAENELDDEMLIGHTETETEDDEYGHIRPFHPKPRRARVPKRKRQSTLDSTSTSSGGASRWDELIEAATTRAVVENSPMPLSPPPTANTLPPICPATPSGESSNGPISTSPCVQCAECRILAPLKQSYICTECVAGFCGECALTAGKRGICSECRAFGGKFKPLNVVIR